MQVFQTLLQEKCIYKSYLNDYVISKWSSRFCHYLQCSITAGYAITCNWIKQFSILVCSFTNDFHMNKKDTDLLLNLSIVEHAI